MREMKDSGVEWIGEIPEQWRLAKIGNFYQITLGKMLETKQSDDGYSLENYLCSANIKWKAVDTSINKKMWFSEAERIQYLLKEGDVLITEGGSAGTACLYNGEFSPCYIQNSVFRCSASEIDNKYLYYWMHVVYHGGYIDSICNRATIQHYTKDKLQHTPIIYLPKEDKIRIIRYLDEKCTRIDGVIEKQQAAIEKLKEYKLSIITEKVSNGLNPCVSTKYSGNEFIGSIPSHWKCVKIKNVSIVVTDGAHVSPETENGVYDFISTVNVEQDRIDFDNCLKTTESSYQYLVSTGCRPLSGDVLISKDGSVGRTAIVNTDRDFVVSSSLVIIRPKIEMITSEYLNFVLQSAFVQETLLMLMHGAGLRRVSVNKNANLPVLLPPIDEQKDIVKYLEKKCSDIEKDITKRRIIVEELFMYKKSIIFEVVTGKKEI